MTTRTVQAALASLCPYRHAQISPVESRPRCMTTTRPAFNTGPSLGQAALQYARTYRDGNPGAGLDLEVT